MFPLNRLVVPTLLILIITVWVVLYTPKPPSKRKIPRCLPPHQWKCGDILLGSANNSSIVRDFQKVVLNSPYTHISMVISVTASGEPLLIESIQTGVHILSLTQTLKNSERVHEKCYYKQLIPPLTVNQIHKIQSGVDMLCGAKYSFSAWKALLYKWQPLLTLPSTSQHDYSHTTMSVYCSELIAIFYSSINIARFNKPLDTVLPCDFINSSLIHGYKLTNPMYISTDFAYRK